MNCFRRIRCLDCLLLDVLNSPDFRSEALGIAAIGGVEWIVGWSGAPAISVADPEAPPSVTAANLKAVLMKRSGATGTWVDLNDKFFIHGASGWTLKLATAVNSGGLIVGNGILNGYAKGFLLVPRTPAP